MSDWKGPDVALAYLSPGSESSSFAFCKDRLLVHELGRVGWPPFLWRQRVASGRIVEGRNELVTAFLDRTGCSWLLFVDSDMGFGPDLLQRLLEAADENERPVMGALCFGLKTEGTDEYLQSEKFRTFPTVYVWAEDEKIAGFKVVPEYPRDSIVECDATGAACILIHRKVLEAIRSEHGGAWFDPIRHPKQPDPFGEDMSFCIRVGQAGFPIYVDTAIKTSHDKGGIFLTEDTWDDQQALVAIGRRGGLKDAVTEEAVLDFDALAQPA